MKLPKVLRSRASRDREAYIASSLAPSKFISTQLLDSSTSDHSKTRLHSMSFHKEWRHPECKVMKWYGLHTTTNFTSIQHWKNLDTQFYHEFLVVQLTDGSACRIERMGEGSRTNAVRRIGCTAYDLIQWFSPEDNLAKKWSRGLDEMIIQVEFPRAFDLLDILAVCHTIQHNSRRASVYTLQRFNCYFLCCTILAVLTRRVAEWEKLITPDKWIGLVDETFDDLERSSLMPIEDQNSVEYFAIGVCALLDPNSPTPTRFIIDLVRSKMNLEACKDLNKACAGSLWYTQCTLAPYRLRGSRFDIREMVKTEHAPDPRLIELYELMATKNKDKYPEPEVGIDRTLIHKCLSDKIAVSISSWAQRYGELCVGIEGLIKRMEESPRRRLRLMTLTLASILALSLPLVSCLGIKLGMLISRKIRKSLSKLGGASWALRSVSSVPLSTRFALLESLMYFIMSGESEESSGIQGGPEMIVAWVRLIAEEWAGLLFSAQLVGVARSAGKPDIPAMLAFLSSYLDHGWWRTYMEHCLFARISNAMSSSITDSPGKITTHAVDGTRVELSVIEFQKYIRQRIDSHSERVESARLATAPLVRADIIGVMGEIWRDLPSGFGGASTSAQHPPR